VTREFLLEEKQKAENQTETDECRFSECQNCGVSDFATTKNIFAAKDEIKTVQSSSPLPDAAIGTEKKYRLTFSKLGHSRFLSHLELSQALVRALRRSSLTLAYSFGYHPHPKISFATATAVGMGSRQEYADITAQEYLSNLNLLKSEINSALPEGIEILEISKLSYEEKAIAQMLKGFEYELYLPAAIDSSRLKAMEENIKNFLATSEFKIQKISKGKTVIKDIRPFVQSLVLDTAGKKIFFAVPHIQEGSARPTDIIAHVLKSDADESQKIKVVRTKSILD
jgi:radical SAM-linked protein